MADPLESLRTPIVPIEPRLAFSATLLKRLEGDGEEASPPPTVRYFVDDIDAAIAFYCDLLGFEQELHPSPSFAMLYRGELRLLLSTPDEAHALPDGTLPQSGGWNCISPKVMDLRGAVQALRRHGARFRTDIAAGEAVETVTLQDPAGNPVELFEPRSGYHERPRASGA